MEPEENSPDTGEKALTSIHVAYTLSNTENAELDKNIVKQFLDILAEVALAVASRKTKP